MQLTPIQLENRSKQLNTILLQYIHNDWEEEEQQLMRPLLLGRRRVAGKLMRRRRVVGRTIKRATLDEMQYVHQYLG